MQPTGTVQPQSQPAKSRPESPGKETQSAGAGAAGGVAADRGQSSRDGSRDSSRQPTPHAIVPVPGSQRQDQPRTSFWRRISMRGGRTGHAGGGGIGDERILARLDVLDSRLTATEQSLRNRLERLDERFTLVWEVEEQLSHLAEIQEVLGDIRDSHKGLEQKVAALNRRLALLAVVAGLALVAAALAAALV